MKQIVFLDRYDIIFYNVFIQKKKGILEMTKEQQLMIKGMDMLLRKFSIMPDDTEVSVKEIIKASNEVYNQILSNDFQKP